MHDWEQACSVLHDRSSQRGNRRPTSLYMFFLYVYIHYVPHFWERDIAHDDLYMQVAKLQRPNT